jgi:hypothetical protein
MKHCGIFFILVVVAAWLQVPPLSARAESDDWVSEYTRTSIAETIKRNTDGDITERTVVTDTKVLVRQKVMEVRQIDTNGIEHVVSRRTDIYDSLAPRVLPIETTIEKQLEAGSGSLVVTAVTTIVTMGSTQTTTYEKRDPERERLVITKRVTKKIDDLGQQILSIETPDQFGNLVVTQTTTLSTL